MVNATLMNIADNPTNVQVSATSKRGYHVNYVLSASTGNTTTLCTSYVYRVALINPITDNPTTVHQ